ncbi:MAG: tetratricopeptide repeat protein [Candidatus Omnitrophica bacterium]|nr:tetratricopeptide repeat protein [Candidatus Omnitrophota bacterium]
MRQKMRVLYRLAISFVLGLVAINGSTYAANDANGIVKVGVLPARSHIDERSFKKALSHYMMGLLYDNEGEFKKAIEEYTKASLADPKSTVFRVKRGVDYLVLGEHKKAVEELSAAKAIEDPENITAALVLGIVYTAQGDYQAAQKEYEDILKKDPQQMKALASLADLFILQKKLTEAQGIYEKLSGAEDSNAPVVHFNLGVIYAKLNKVPQAIGEFEKTIVLVPDYIDAYIMLGLLYEMQGNLARAEDVYRKGVGVDPSDERLYGRLAAVLFDSNKAPESCDVYREALKRFPQSTDFYIAFSAVYIREQKYDDALSVLDKAKASGLKDPRLYSLRGYACMMQGKIDEAIAIYREGLTNYAENGLLHFYLGMAYDTAHDRAKATSELRAAVKYDQTVAEAYNYLGYILAEEGKDLDEAEGLIKKALEMDPANGAYIDSLGWVYYKKGDFKKAVTELERAVSVEDKNAVIRDHLGDAYYALKLFDKAKEEWEKAVHLDPEQAGIGEKIKRIQGEP